MPRLSPNAFFQTGVALVLVAAFLTVASSQVHAQAPVATPTPFKPHDEFYWLEEMNKASAVMVVEQGIVSRQLGRTIATSVEASIAAGDAPNGPRPDIAHYLSLEKQWIDSGGPDVTRIHSGRSRQDLIATGNRLKLRERDLELVDHIARVRQRMAHLAAANLDTIIPAYTNGVQAQPITFAHYLLAYAAALGRDSDRIRSAYERLNLSPLGSAALGTSSFPIDRRRLASLLGFDGLVENSFDANLVSSLDVPLESVQIGESSALTIGALVEDLELQYHETEPWLLLREGTLTGPSSIMPQKRNPYGLQDVRDMASDVEADAQAFALRAHNVAAGMPSYKHGEAEKTLDDTMTMLDQLATVLDSVVINRKRGLAEVNDDYSTTTELADVLQRECDVPFRIGHHFASELVTYGRDHHLRASELPYAEAQRIYTKSAATFGLSNATLPLDEANFRRALTPENMIASARVTGGPAPAEVERMLKEEQLRIEADLQWSQAKREKLAAAAASLDAAFRDLMAP